jgi:hypothetical protein
VKVVSSCRSRDLYGFTSGYISSEKSLFHLLNKTSHKQLLLNVIQGLRYTIVAVTLLLPAANDPVTSNLVMLMLAKAVVEPRL